MPRTLGRGDNLDAIEAILTVNGRGGRVVEGLAGRADLISRGDSRGATSTVLIASLLLRLTVAKPPKANGSGKADTNSVVVVVGVAGLSCSSKG